jgi:hypothetical protein
MAQLLWPVNLVAPRAGERLFIVQSDFPESGRVYVASVLPCQVMLVGSQATAFATQLLRRPAGRTACCAPVCPSNGNRLGVPGLSC